MVFNLEPTILDVLDRAQTGPKCTVKEWDTKIIPAKTAEKVSEYRIKFDQDIIIPSDNTLIDDVFQAGFELAVETGVLCTDTGRVIKFDEDELKHTMKETTRNIHYGDGPERVVVVQRQPEDKRPPVHSLGPFGIAVSEDVYLPVHEAHSRCRYNDILVPGVLPTVYGREIRAGTPYEVLGIYLEAALVREAVRRAGRPGMGVVGPVGDWTGVAALAGVSYGYYTRNDALPNSMVSELKTNNFSLNKAVQTAAHSINSWGGSHPIIGGYCGGAEGAAVMAVAAMILVNVVYQTRMPEATPTDARTMGDTTREALWASSVAIQAVDRNTRLPYRSDVTGNLDVFTEEFLYETAVCSMVLSVSGVALSAGPRPSGGRYSDHTTPVETHLQGEVGVHVAGMKREDANELASRIVPRYEKELLYPPAGKTFREVMDMKTLKPRKEWAGMYMRVRKDLVEMGVLKE